MNAAHEQALAGQLLDCLHAEHAALARGDAEAIRDCARNKLEYFRLLEPYAAQPAHALSPQLLDTLRACRDQNLANGAVIEQQRRATHQALAVLRGSVAEPALYGPAGTSPSLPGGRSLATA
jgi:flagellar biosynthesis/type III secretory pathway chaperone